MAKFEKPGKKEKPNKTDEEYLSLVASIGCIICGKEATIHHIRLFGEPRNHKKAIPLCYNHHQGEEGIHHLGKKEWRKKYGHELEYLKEFKIKLTEMNDKQN